MKSAYELAMERLQKTSPSLSLTDEQRKDLAELDSKYRAKIAEKELFLNDQIRKAQTGGKMDDIDSLQKQEGVRTIKRAHMLGFLDPDLPKRRQTSAREDARVAAFVSNARSK